MGLDDKIQNTTQRVGGAAKEEAGRVGSDPGRARGETSYGSGTVLGVTGGRPVL